MYEHARPVKQATQHEHVRLKTVRPYKTLLRLLLAGTSTLTQDASPHPHSRRNRSHARMALQVAAVEQCGLISAPQNECTGSCHAQMCQMLLLAWRSAAVSDLCVQGASSQALQSSCASGKYCQPRSPCIKTKLTITVAYIQWYTRCHAPGQHCHPQLPCIRPAQLLTMIYTLAARLVAPKACAPVLAGGAAQGSGTPDGPRQVHLHEMCTAHTGLTAPAHQPIHVVILQRVLSMLEPNVTPWQARFESVATRRSAQGADLVLCLWC